VQVPSPGKCIVSCDELPKNSCLVSFVYCLFGLFGSIFNPSIFGFLIAAEGVMRRGDSPSHVMLLDDELPPRGEFEDTKENPSGEVMGR
jgi:hypothetical protein